MKAKCGCEYWFSNNSIIEFSKVCDKHKNIVRDSAILLKEIIKDALETWALGAWKPEPTHERRRILA